MSRRITVRLEGRLSNALAAECARRGITPSELVRQAVKDTLRARSSPSPASPQEKSIRAGEQGKMALRLSPAPPLPSARMPAGQPKESRQPSESVGQVAVRLMGQPNTVRAEAERHQPPESIGKAAARFLGQPHRVRPEAQHHFRELLAASIAAQRTCPDDPVAQALSDLMRLRGRFGVAEKDV